MDNQDGQLSLFSYILFIPLLLGIQSLLDKENQILVLKYYISSRYCIKKVLFSYLSGVNDKITPS